MHMELHQCCGCGACGAICPHGAIRLADGPGGVYPKIDPVKCTQCGLCEEVCPSHNRIVRQKPRTAWAAACREKKELQKSASGGVFWALARTVLEQDGAVFGCAMPAGEKRPRHIMVDSVEQLGLLQGSKYAQSDTETVYPQVKQQLKKGRKVLFSGTPCQVAGLYGFLRGGEWPNLVTVDLICHGVPGWKMLEDYLCHLEQKKRIQIQSFAFRGKQEGWGSFRFCMDYSTASGKARQQELPAARSSYYWLFLKGATYRENCYSCPYACMERVADITIGDFWGVQETYPQLLGQEKERLDPQMGISCVLANSVRGEQALLQSEDLLKRKQVEPAAIALHNRQLQRPQEKPDFRQAVMNLYEEKGYAAVEKWYQARLGWKRWLYPIRDWMKR